MHIICLTPLAEGVYNDHCSDSITTPPKGWAYIPTEDGPIPEAWKNTVRDYSLPSTFPRLGGLTAEELTYIREVEVQKKVIKTRETGAVDDEGNPITEEYTEMETVTEEREYTMMTVTSMTEGTLPEPVEPEPSEADDTAAMLVDHEYRLTLLELGITE